MLKPIYVFYAITSAWTIFGKHVTILIIFKYWCVPKRQITFINVIHKLNTVYELNLKDQHQPVVCN